jgi:hypothetical protein
LLWICLGVVFIGAVHDLSTLIASVRHGGSSIAEVIREQLGPGAGITMMAFIWLALVYVIVAFTDDGHLRRQIRLRAAFIQPGRAVAVAATLYLLLAILMGLVGGTSSQLWLQTIILSRRPRRVWLLEGLDAPVLSHGTWGRDHSTASSPRCSRSGRCSSRAATSAASSSTSRSRRGSSGSSSAASRSGSPPSPTGRSSAFPARSSPSSS